MNGIETEAVRQRLSAMYADLSKHSSYQNIPDFVSKALDYRVEIREDWRGDRVRLRYIDRMLGASHEKRWCDIGANTGYFALTIAHRHPERDVLAIEANPNHARFIAAIKETFDVKNVSVMEESITIDTLERIPQQDVILHLNVLHHAGADFDRGRVDSSESFGDYAIEYLSRLRARTRTLVFQLGSNLWGDKARPLVDHRMDAAKLSLFAAWLVRAGWILEDVAYAAKDIDGAIEYRSLETPLRQALSGNPSAVPLADVDLALAPFNLASHIGEFYRRPLFICATR